MTQHAFLFITELYTRYKNKQQINQFAMLPYTSLLIWLRLVADVYIMYNYQAAARSSLLRVTSTPIRWRCRTALTHLSPARWQEALTNHKFGSHG